jgi:hypothetical protein
VDLYKEQLALSERLANSWKAMEKSFSNMPHPFAPVSHGMGKPKDTPGLFGVQPTGGIEGPDFGNHPLATTEMPDLFPASKFGSALGEVKDFYAAWNLKASGTVDAINTDYDNQIKHWKELLTSQAISQQQFNDISLKLENARQQGFKNLRQEMGLSTAADAIGDLFTGIANRGRDVVRSFTDGIGAAVEGLNHQLATFATTGKGMDLRKLGSSFLESVTSTGLGKLESMGASALDLGVKRDGSSTAAALYVQDVNNPLGAGIGAAPGAIAQAAQGGGGFWGSMLGLITGFLPHLAGGGDVTPGKAYVVGENHPEFFVPNTPGTVHPSLKMGGSTTIAPNIIFPGVTDHDSFRKNQSQIGQHIANAVGRANSRG